MWHQRQNNDKSEFGLPIFLTFSKIGKQLFFIFFAQRMKKYYIFAE